MLENLHIGILLVAVGIIAYADHQALGYLRGTHPVLDKRRTMILHHAVWALLGGMILTGLALAWRGLGFYLTVPAFQLKLFFVGILVVNSFVITRIMQHAFITPFAQLSSAQRRMMFVSGLASGIGWVGAIALGLYLFF